MQALDKSFDLLGVFALQIKGKTEISVGHFSFSKLFVNFA